MALEKCVGEVPEESLCLESLFVCDHLAIDTRQVDESKDDVRPEELRRCDWILGDDKFLYVGEDTEPIQLVEALNMVVVQLETHYLAEAFDFCQGSVWEALEGEVLDGQFGHLWVDMLSSV